LSATTPPGAVADLDLHNRRASALRRRHHGVAIIIKGFLLICHCHHHSPTHGMRWRSGLQGIKKSAMIVALFLKNYIRVVIV
jgi:hypothetical protein